MTRGRDDVAPSHACRTTVCTVVVSVAPVFKPERTGAVYRVSVIKVLRIFPPATKYPNPTGYIPEPCGIGFIPATFINKVWCLVRHHSEFLYNYDVFPFNSGENKCTSNYYKGSKMLYARIELKTTMIRKVLYGVLTEIKILGPQHAKLLLFNGNVHVNGS